MTTHSAETEYRDARRFEWYARFVWPVHRLFARKVISQRCVRCIASERVAPLSAQGLCALCTATPPDKTVVPDTTEHERQLDQILSTTHGSARYDALVLFSGGKDSTLLTHLLKTNYPRLRLLAFTFDNSFMSVTAQENIKRVVAKMNIDHVTVEAPKGFCEKVFAYALAHRGMHGCAAVVDPIDGALIFDAARHYAAQRSIPLILIGLSPDQLAHYEGQSALEADPAFEHSKRTHATLFRVEDLSPGDTSFWWDAARYEASAVARILYPFVAWRFSEEVIKKTVVELGYLEPDGLNPLVTNSQLIPLETVADVWRLGYSSWEPEFTTMVREGRANKLFWRNTFELAEYSAKTNRLLGNSIDALLERLHLTRSDVA